MSFVEPVRSVSTAAICEPLAGNSQTPISEGHMAVMSSPSGLMIVSSLAEMKVSAIHAIPNSATAAT